VRKSKLAMGLAGLAMTAVLACSTNGDDTQDFNNGSGQQQSNGQNCTVVRDPLFIVRQYENSNGEIIIDEVLETTKGLACDGRTDITRVPTAYGDTINVGNHRDNPCGDKKYNFSVLKPYTDAKMKYLSVAILFPNPNGPCPENNIEY